MTRSTTTPSPHVLALVAALTAHRGTITARVPQASTPTIRRELDGFVDREREVLATLAGAAGLPRETFDERTSGRTPTAAVAAVASSIAPLDQALLSDVAVVRAIADRAHVAHLAVSTTDQAELASALAGVRDFHREWAEWELAAAGELAAGGVPRLEPTAAQKAAEAARRIATLPGRVARGVAEKANELVSDVATTAAEQAQHAAAEVAGSVTTAVGAASDAVDKARTELAEQAQRVVRVTDAAWSAGRDAALREGDHEAQRAGADVTADVLHETRAELGVLDADELPIRGYDALTAPEVVSALERITEPRDLRTLDAYEREHKNRKTVVDALQQRSTELVSA